MGAVLAHGAPGNLALLPALWALLACQDKYAVLPLVAICGLVANIPLAVLVMLGQDYLPSRPGPLVVLALIPIAAVALSAGLRKPD